MQTILAHEPAGATSAHAFGRHVRVDRHEYHRKVRPRFGQRPCDVDAAFAPEAHVEENRFRIKLGDRGLRLAASGRLSDFVTTLLQEAANGLTCIGIVVDDQEAQRAN